MRRWATHLLQTLSKFVQHVENTVIVYHLIGIERFVAPAGTEDEIDEFRLCEVGRLIQ